MIPAEKVKNNKSEIKTQRINRIYEAAFKLFSEKGIDTIIMTDIAEQSKIGVASLYRYFETKDEVAIQTIIWAWNKQKEFFLPALQTSEYEKKSGIEQLNEIFNMFIKLYETQPDFLRFVYFFDSFAVRINIEQNRLIEYEAMIKTVQKVVAKAIHKGIEDKTINGKYKDSEDVLYFTLMHTLFGTSQKLSLSGNMLYMDSLVQGKTQLETLSQVLLNGIKTC